MTLLIIWYLSIIVVTISYIVKWILDRIYIKTRNITIKKISNIFTAISVISGILVIVIFLILNFRRF